jgi:glycosyltransferase involved in cell wall biosynthesis
MTYILKNPSGIIVEIDDKEDFKSALRRPGFDILTPEETTAYNLRRDSQLGKATGLVDVQFEAPKPHNDGYGQSHKLLMDALLPFGIKLNRDYEGQQVGLAYGYPESVNNLKTPTKILFTMFESTKIPPDWDVDLKKTDLILVPSGFCQKTLKDAGYNSIVVPLAYDHVTFKYEEKDPDKEPFIFLHYDAFNQRKGWDLVFKAFNEEFRSENVRLVLKTTKIGGYPFPILKSQYPQIDVIKEPYRPNELADLLHNSDCFVFPSRGEGFGIPPLEALATGTPVIVPNAHGIAEYFTNKYFLGIEVKGTCPALYERYKGIDTGTMVEPDIKSLKNQMRFAYEHRSYVYETAKQGAAWVSGNYTYEKTAEKLAPILKDFRGSVHNPIESDQVKTKEIRQSIIILTHNALFYTKKCVASILDNTPDNYELIIIDNASTDGTQEWLKSVEEQKHNFPLTVIYNKENQGVAGGRNQGLKKASGEIVTFLDNDTEVSEGWQDIIFEEFKIETVGVVGKGGQLVPFLKPIKFRDPQAIEGRSVCDVVPGFCLSFRRFLIYVVGTQYDKLPNSLFWHEDLDFCLRVQMAGYQIIGNENIKVKHYGHKSIGDNVTNEESVKLTKGYFENAAAIQERLAGRNVLTIYRDFNGFDAAASYDRVARGIVKSLRDLGVVVIFKPSVSTGPASFNLCKGFDMTYEGKRLIWLHQENDRCPKDWVDPMRHVDYALAASPHLLDVCKEEPYFKKLIDQSPDGVSEFIYNFNVKPVDLFPGKFKFLMVGATQPRKNTANLIKWYTETFTKKDKVVLILKDVGYGQRDVTQALIGNARANKNCPQIEHIYEDWSSDYLASVYKGTADNGVYIHPHRAECFGLPQIEALACGLRVGTTGWGGPKYNLKGIPGVTFFGFEMKPSAFHNHAGEPYYTKDEAPEWAEPNELEVKKFMIDIQKEIYNKTTAKKASRMILDRFSYKKVGEKIKQVLCTI